MKITKHNHIVILWFVLLFLNIHGQSIWEEDLPLAPASYQPTVWTCDPTSVAHSLPFCNPTLSNEARVADLLDHMPLDIRISHFVFNMAALPEINVKGFQWDATCIQGLDWPTHGNLNVTVFPNAIAQAATFDVDLIAQLSNVTAHEFRSVRSPTDTGIPGVCDGGPLANTAHDPRWGRNSETYGEDPFLSSRMGVTAVQYLQQRTMFNGKEFVLIPQVTRHYLGFHGAHPDSTATMTVSQRNLEESYFPIYEAFQTEGRAEGIMCSYGDVDGVPSCANKEMLQTKLREEWKSDAIIQCDCCDSVSSIVGHKYVDTQYEALLVSVDAGLQLYYGYDRKDYAKYWGQALNNSDLTEKQLNDSISRILLTRFRMGEFDDIPWQHLNKSEVIDTPEHRAIARKVGAASVVLLKNTNHFLPLAKESGVLFPRGTRSDSTSNNIAVIGPFAHCPDVDRKSRGYGSRNPYLHNYSGSPSNVTTIFDAFKEYGDSHGVGVTWAAGVNDTGDVNDHDLQAAVTMAQNSDLVILCLGLGAKIEAESKDRTFLTLPDSQITLLNEISKLGKRMIITLVSAGGIDLPYDDVGDAILQVWYGGQSTGYSVTDVVFGDYVPSGRLPVTIYQNTTLALLPNINYFDLELGVGRTYRYLQQKPLLQHYGFGFGLSYTTFAYSNVTTSVNTTHVRIMFTITNTGTLDAHEVYQIYVKVPTVDEHTPIPIHSLKAFGKVFIAQGGVVHVDTAVANEALRTVLNDGSKQLTSGAYTVSIGGQQPDEWRNSTSGACLSTTVNI